jgi:hypothetical protein
MSALAEGWLVNHAFAPRESRATTARIAANKFFFISDSLFLLTTHPPVFNRHFPSVVECR